MVVTVIKMTRRMLSAAVMCLSLSMLLPRVAASECPIASETNTIWVISAPPAVESEDGIGGTGLAEPVRAEFLALGHGGGHGGDDDGIGGTGHTGSGEDDGIGGSGLFGTVTGFGSICLNGRRIQYDAEVSVFFDGESATSDDLEIGQVVKVVARDEKALVIDIVFAVVGPVAEVNTASFTVMGQVVEPAKGSIVDWDSLVAGHRVAVSGLRRPDGTIVASRVDPAYAALTDRVMELDIEDLFDPEVDQIDVEGYVHAVGVDGLNLGYVHIDSEAFDDGETSTRPEVGARVRVRASRTSAGNFAAQRVELLREEQLLQDFERLDFERSRHRRSRLRRSIFRFLSRPSDMPEPPPRIDYPQAIDRLDPIDRPPRSHRHPDGTPRHKH